jgi:hypothetical protein
VVAIPSLLSGLLLPSHALLSGLLTPVFPRHFDTLFLDPGKLSPLKNFPNYLKLDSSIYCRSCSSALIRLTIFGCVENISASESKPDVLLDRILFTSSLSWVPDELERISS